MTALRPRLALAATLGAQGLLVAVLIGRTDVRHHVQWLYCLSLPVFALSVWLLTRCRLPRQQAVLLILGASAVLQLLAVTHSPTTSDDDFRYIWDAKVQLAGVDPYRYPPDAPQLARLRDDFLFPRDSCPHRIADGCTAINRPRVRTIYPPVAQGAFVLVRVASFGGNGRHLPVQLAGALGVLAVAWLLARRARAHERGVWSVAVWAWCPLPIVEYSNAGHIDWLAVLFVVLALSYGATRRAGLAGLLLGAAIATKLYPAVVIPSLLRRRPGVVLGAAIALVALSYVPHVLAVGTAVLGYLPGYLREEQYASGDRLLLLGWLLPHPVDTVIGLILLGGAALLVWRRVDPAAPERSAVVLMGVTLLVTTPVYGWYAGLLLALIAMSRAVEWLPIALTPTVVYLVRKDFGPSLDVSREAYAIAAGLTLLLFLARRYGTARRTRSTAAVPDR